MTDRTSDERPKLDDPYALRDALARLPIPTL